MRACRMAPSCPWQVFVAAARSEWRRNGETDVARKIFERGLAPRPRGADLLAVAPYVAAYADFLCGEWGALGWGWGAWGCTVGLELGIVQEAAGGLTCW
jgi:hypothetical protein